MKWRDVKKDPPPPHKDVLTGWNGSQYPCIEIGRFDERGQYLSCNGPVSHWMLLSELPPMPKETNAGTND